MTLFAPSSPFNTRIPADAPIDPMSDEIIAAMLPFAQNATIDTTRYSVPIYHVGPDQPTVKVLLNKTTNNMHNPLQIAWEHVPLPANAQGAAGSDGHCVVIQGENLFEFWRLVRLAGGPAASWGGAMNDISARSGAYDTSCWPGAQNAWGASACSISIAAGTMLIDELRLGKIAHALAFALPPARKGVWVPPAKRSDGLSESAISLPEGARLRLDPTLDLTTIALPPFTRMIAEALQEYGMFMRDSGSGKGMPFYGQDPTPFLPEDPYAAIFGGHAPSVLLKPIPWARLQLLEMTLAGPRA